MFGAIVGDIIGRPYEMVNFKSKAFPLFSDKSRPTDDSMLTIAVADAFMNKRSVHRTLQDYYHLYPNAGYGMNFKLWAKDRIQDELESTGNGSAMRVSSVAYIFDDIDTVLEKAKESALPSHHTFDAISGAQVIAGLTHLARKIKDRNILREFAMRFYDVNFDYEILVDNYEIGYTCSQSVPQAIFCFLIAKDFEDTMRTCVSIGGDTDTICAMAGAIAEAYYDGVPQKIFNEAMMHFEMDALLYGVMNDFIRKHCPYGYELQWQS